MKLFLIAVLLALCISKSYHMETNDNDSNNDVHEPVAFQETNKDSLTLNASQRTKQRTKRGIWDIFQKVVITKNLIVDQYTDTRDSFNEVYNLFNNQFSDPNPPKPTYRPGPTTPAPKSSSEESSETKTTKKPFKISQYELGQILGRNLKGLQRLAALEFQDSLNATKYNLQEYQAEANKQFANSLVSEKKKRLRG